MFSFHKPRVYRSTEGCCICRAKSSSSRFTDSRKYEDDSIKCFNLKQPRHGEICNACVLLVKRYKRLPAGSTRNWGHVVDARAGPGTKSLTKTKRGGKDDSEPSSVRGSSSLSSSGSNNVSRQSQNTKSLLQEKFSKIFKKTKKVKVGNGGGSSSSSGASNNTSASANSGSKKEMNKRRSNTKSWRDNDSLPTTPDSLDSDYEENRLAVGATSNGATTVQFQTQTRASSYRSRKNAISASAAMTALRQKHKQLPKVGSKRRKVLPPRKNRNPNKNVQFFDESEWQQKKSCCGTVYESTAMSGAIIIDWEHYKPCMVHRRVVTEQQQATQSPKSTIIATMPAVVQLAPPPAPIPSAAPTPLPTPATAASNKPTPALKKHHLFFKRQSESFPHADLSGTNYNGCVVTTSSGSNISLSSGSNSSSNTNNNTTKLLSNNCSISSNNNNNNSSTTIVSAISAPQHQLPQPLQINSIGNCPSGVPVYPGSTATIVSSSGGAYACNGVQLPKHSTAKITTITPAAVPTTAAAQLSRQQHNYLHKVKTTDAGKIIKHSLEKINTAAVRAKPNEMSDMKHLIKTVDKSYMLARPSVATITTISQQQQQQQHLVPQQSHIPITIGAYTAGCSPSSTSSSSTKFSDNSSDSGFDENMQDRKSVSPLQEDTERKLVTRSNPGVQTMFLASGVQIQGQQQNLVLTGNEVAAKILNNRKQQATTISVHQQRNNRVNMSGPTASVKIAQIVAGASVSVAGGAVVTNNGTVVGGPHTKMRTIYNNNTIQHENGVTTIVPASSLAATTQTAAMNAIAPSTVTITPAPHIATAPVATTLNNLSGKKHINTGGNLMTLNSAAGGGVSIGALNNLHGSLGSHTHQQHVSNVANINSSGNGNTLVTAHHLNGINNNVAAGLNQKIILVKTTSTKYGNNHNNNSNNNNNNTNNTIVNHPMASISGGTSTITALNGYNQGACKK